MKNLLFGLVLIFTSTHVFSQTINKVEPKANAIQPSNEEEQGSDKRVAAPTDSSTSTYSVKIKKKPFKLPAIMAPANTTIDANCADRLGKGDSGYTACEAGKRTR